MKFSVKISDHDYSYRVEQIRKFLAKRHSVLVTIQFRGREVTHPELGEAILCRVLMELNKKGKSTLKGKTLQVLITP